jgi:hypothetical protein
MRSISGGFYERRGRVAFLASLGWGQRFNRAGYAWRLPANWREVVEALVWFWGWEPRVVMDMTMTEIRRWNAAAQRLGPRVVRAVLVKAMD